MLRIALQAGDSSKLHMFYYTYVLQSLKDSQLYVGWTDDLKGRVAKHNAGSVQSTKERRPFRLIYYEACLSKKSAVMREKALKTGFGRAYLKRRLTIYIPR